MRSRAQCLPEYGKNRAECENKPGSRQAPSPRARDDVRQRGNAAGSLGASLRLLGQVALGSAASDSEPAVEHRQVTLGMFADSDPGLRTGGANAGSRGFAENASRNAPRCPWRSRDRPGRTGPRAIIGLDPFCPGTGCIGSGSFPECAEWKARSAPTLRQSGFRPPERRPRGRAERAGLQAPTNPLPRKSSQKTEIDHPRATLKCNTRGGGGLRSSAQDVANRPDGGDSPCDEARRLSCRAAATT